MTQELIPCKDCSLTDFKWCESDYEDEKYYTLTCWNCWSYNGKILRPIFMAHGKTKNKVIEQWNAFNA